MPSVAFLQGLPEKIAHSSLQGGGSWPNAGIVVGPKRAIAWRVLDAQYFGVAQRRRRVFVVASARDGFDCARVLFEFDGVRRDIAPSREAGQTVAPTIRAGAANGGRGHGARSGDSKDELITMAHGQGGAEIARGYAPTLTCNHEAPIIGGIDHEMNPHGADDVTGPLLKGSPTGGGRPSPAVALTANPRVRRLTPIECERLQGFPDNYTQIPYRKKPAQACPHGPRYKALGNSWAVPVVWWIGFRMQWIGGLV